MTTDRIRELRLTEEEMAEFYRDNEGLHRGMAYAQYDKLLRGLIEWLMSDDFPDPTPDDIMGQSEQEPRIVIGWSGALILVEKMLREALENSITDG